MSIKIYHGHEIVGHSLDSFLGELRVLRAELKEEQQKLVTQAVTRIAVNRHDAVLLGLRPDEAPRNFLQEVQDRFWESQRTCFQEGRRDPFVDFSFSVSAIPVDGRLLAVTFTDQKSFQKLWDAKPWRRDFSYWNNTDEPDDISPEDWAERASLWRRAFDDYRWTPGEAGYRYDITNERPDYPWVSDEEVAAVLPSAAQRADSQLIDFLEFECLQQGVPPPKKHSEFVAMRESEHGVQTLAALVARFEQLPLTVAALKGEVA